MSGTIACENARMILGTRLMTQIVFVCFYKSKLDKSQIKQMARDHIASFKEINWLTVLVVLLYKKKV